MPNLGLLKSLGSAIDHSLASVPPEKPLMVVGDATLTYGGARERISRFLSFFAAAGLEPGDRVMIVSTDDMTSVVLFLAAVRAGLAAIIGDRDMPRDELSRLIALAEPRAVFVDAAVADELAGRPCPATASFLAIPTATPEPQPDQAQRVGALAIDPLLDGIEPGLPASPPSDDQVALIVFTSGTTSRPKGVQLTHGNLRAQQVTFSRVYGFDEDSRIFNLLPLHHVDGLIRGPLAAFLAGGTVYRVERFRAQLLPSMLRGMPSLKMTHFVAVPSLLALILRLAGDERDCMRGKDFRHVISSADLLDATLWRRFEEHFGVNIVNAYGLSETVCDALFCGPTEATRRVGTIGKPEGCEARIVNDRNADVPPGETGELLIRGPIVMSGYFRQPEATAEVLIGGWFHTGDLVRRTDEGFYEFVGRKKNVIKSRGVGIQPETITSAIRGMSGVVDAVTLGVADELRGQLIVSCAVVEKDSAINEFVILDHCQRSLPPEKQPSRVLIVDELPRGPAGKFVLSEVERIAREAVGRVERGLPIKDVYSIAATCFRAPQGSLSAESTPFNTEGWDSVAHLELILALEKSFGVTFSAADILNFESLADAERIVASYLHSRPA